MVHIIGCEGLSTLDKRRKKLCDSYVSPHPSFLLHFRDSQCHLVQFFVPLCMLRPFPHMMTALLSLNFCAGRDFGRKTKVQVKGRKKGPESAVRRALLIQADAAQRVPTICGCISFQHFHCRHPFGGDFDRNGHSPHFPRRRSLHIAPQARHSIHGG